MTGEWAKKMRHIETVEYYLALKKKVIHSNMDKSGDDHAKWISQTEENKDHDYLLFSHSAMSNSFWFHG